MPVRTLAPNGVDLVGVPHQLEKEKSSSEDVGPRRGWIVTSHIGWGGEQNTLWKGVETFTYQTRFKAVRESPKGKDQRRQYLLAVDFGRYKIHNFPNDFSQISSQGLLENERLH